VPQPNARSITPGEQEIEGLPKVLEQSLASEAQETFSQIVRVFSKQPYRMRVEGHTDNVPIHNDRFASNWEISTSRATEVVRLLLMQGRFRPENLAAG
jgi:chemotaxis protein MotB